MYESCAIALLDDAGKSALDGCLSRNSVSDLDRLVTFLYAGLLVDCELSSTWSVNSGLAGCTVAAVLSMLSSMAGWALPVKGCAT